MCTCPRIIRRKVINRIREDIVPCGKCHECLSKQQNEFAALACLEAKRSSSMYMVAFTYSNRTCPIMRTCKNECDEFEVKDFVEGRDRLLVLPDMVRERFENGRRIEYLVSTYRDGFHFEPSLHREDVRLFLKSARQAFHRKYGYYPSFRYAAFGEYGDKYHRPHTHFLFFGLKSQEMAFIADQWKNKFGFADVKEIPVLNRDGSPARVKVSKYVSKYLRKPKTDFLPLLHDLCERPRLIVSKGFGKDVLPSNLKSFYLCEDLSHLNFSQRAEEILKRKKSLIIDGVRFPLPRKISDQYFRVEAPSKIKTVVNEKSGEITLQNVRQTRRSALSLQVSRFARDRYYKDFIDKVFRYSETHSDKDIDLYLHKVCEDEGIALEDRARYARKIYLQYLTKQKYG